MNYIPFEKSMLELETQIHKLQKIASTEKIDLEGEMRNLQDKSNELRSKIFSGISDYEVVQLSRHPRRPNTLEYINFMCESFEELHGDRGFYDDPAMVGGIASFRGFSVVVVGQQKGRGTKENIRRNFGMPRPEGYRKALRLFEMGERFNMPIVCLIDTPGAYPGVGAEQRGQSQAIAHNIMRMSSLKVPVTCAVIGEGGSGGALAIAVGNRVHMMEYAVYSVISPEGCASILSKDSRKAADMAQALRLTAPCALSHGIIDSVIKEPSGGAHRCPAEAAENLSKRLYQDLCDLNSCSADELRKQRHDRFLALGCFDENMTV
ncbi:MAG: acetyl-CoA carboxylase carboxyl transferase subunit alpha [Zetaproteobacteria bacterium]|nr:acetyl-CoA carboxylase carboxyl transferase subunit alpha [Pseudobdellovibrionaceae bacterium]